MRFLAISSSLSESQHLFLLCMISSCRRILSSQRSRPCLQDGSMRMSMHWPLWIPVFVLPGIVLGVKSRMLSSSLYVEHYSILYFLLVFMTALWCMCGLTESQNHWVWVEDSLIQPFWYRISLRTAQLEPCSFERLHGWIWLFWHAVPVFDYIYS